MARTHARLSLELWNDDDWLSLTPRAQHLYMVFLTSPDLSYAGVADWRPGRLRNRAAEWPMLDLMMAAQELSQSYFLIFDDETEEVGIRSFIRHDGLMKQPRMAVSMATAFGRIASRKIRAGIVYELQRLKREEPELEAWSKPPVVSVLKQNAVNPKQMVTDLALPLGMDLGLTLPIGLAQTRDGVSVPPTPTPTPSPTPAPSSFEDAAQIRGRIPQARETVS